MAYSYRRGPFGHHSCFRVFKPSLSDAVVESISDYFDKNFSASLNELLDADNKYRDFVRLQPDLSISFENPLFSVRASEVKALYGQLLATWRSNAELIASKIKSPSIPIELTSTSALITELNIVIEDLNGVTRKHNERVLNKKSALLDLKAEFWQRCRIDYNSVITTTNLGLQVIAEERRKLDVQMSAIAEQIDSMRSELVNLQSKTVNIDTAIGAINLRLHGMGIDSFKIIKVGDSRYRLSRNGISADDFHSLSEGEKTVISSIYFLELCKGKRSPDEVAVSRVVVVDDPISSLSHIYVFHIGQLIKEELSNSDRYLHIIILTHSLYFFYELADMNKDRRELNQKLLRVVKNSAGSAIVSMKYEEVQNDYQAYWNVIFDEAQHPALIANCMRNIIEYFFNFVRKKDLNNVFQMASLKDVKHQAFCRFMNRESHSLGQNIFDYKEFDYPKFKEAFRLVFHESGFPEHYAAMAK